MARYTKFFIVLGISFLFSFYLFISIPTEITPPQLPSYRKSYSSDPVTILFWNNRNPRSHWSGFGVQDNIWSTPNYLGADVNIQCPNQCTITADKSQIGHSDAVIIEGSPDDPTTTFNWLRTPLNLPQKRPGQLWVNFGYDNPEYYPLLKQEGYMTHFDVNMTFDQTNTKTNVPITRHCNWGGGTANEFLNPPKTKSNDKLVAIVMSNCKGNRGKAAVAYAHELSKYITVHSYGDCLDLPDTPKPEQSWFVNDGNDHGGFVKKELELYSEYKFALIFETHNITDFVTEKLSIALKAGTVPVYMGAPNVNEWIPSPKSIIKVSDFEGPKDLAAYLSTLSGNKEQYEEHLSWKNRGLSQQFMEKLKLCIYNQAHCRLCDKVAEIKSSMPDTTLGNSVIMDQSYAVAFDGKSNYVEIGNYFHLEDGYTIVLWCYIDSIHDWRLVDKNTAGKVDGYSLDVLDKGSRGFLRFCSSGGCWMSMKPLISGNWYHLAVTFISSLSGSSVYGQTSGVYFYINGELDYTANFPENQFGIQKTHTNNLPLRIGRAGSGDAFWHGMIDDVSIWGIPLPAKQIRKLMFERLGGRESGLMGYWAFNEGNGDVVHDYGPKKRHGKIYGERVQWVPSETKELTLNPCV